MRSSRAIALRHSALSGFLQSRFTSRRCRLMQPWQAMYSPKENGPPKRAECGLELNQLQLSKLTEDKPLHFQDRDLPQAHPNINIVSFGLAGAAPLAAPSAIARATAQSILLTDFSFDSQ